MRDTGEFNKAHETVTDASQVIIYDWKEDEHYGDKINAIIHALDLSEFHSVIARLTSPELPDGNNIVRCELMDELPGLKMYSFPRVIPGPEITHEDVSNNTDGVDMYVWY